MTSSGRRDMTLFFMHNLSNLYEECKCMYIHTSRLNFTSTEVHQHPACIFAVLLRGYGGYGSCLSSAVCFPLSNCIFSAKNKNKNKCHLPLLFTILRLFFPTTLQHMFATCSGFLQELHPRRERFDVFSLSVIRPRILPHVDPWPVWRIAIYLSGETAAPLKHSGPALWTLHLCLYEMVWRGWPVFQLGEISLSSDSLIVSLIAATFARVGS